MKRLTTLLALIVFVTHVTVAITFRAGADLRVSISKAEAKVVYTALDILNRDYNTVFNAKLLFDKNPNLIIATLDNNPQAEAAIGAKLLDELRMHKEGFLLKVLNDELYILGSDKRGTAYGILELSRLIGVSPWEWWADSFVEKKSELTLDNNFVRMEHPSVAHRGIFLNDEDWGLMPWSGLNYDPSDVKGRIGAKTHARIFELLLRLRANTFWPAMHQCTEAFYITPGNKEMADKYGIFVGTSHCEPMMRNTNAEWKLAGKGEYDYVNNRDAVLKFWDERVTELTGSDNIYTLGIRGVHDGRMLGATTLQEQKDALVNVLKDQREMIARLVNPNVEEVSQVFIPYKEVLDVYNLGLDVPEDVTLLWCDDNYGYIRHFPNGTERARKGGNGVYYHVSYWGRPHDYLWLATNHPAQLYTQMKLAYDKGAQDMWIVNVGDIKPAEYLIELFLDMAWDINRIESNINGLDKHLQAWLSREFGEANAEELLHIMNEYYRLAYICKPEFMGGTREEEQDPKFKIVTDLPWSEQEIKIRLNDYIRISDRVIKLSKTIATEKRDAWFQLIEYPVRGAAEMNKKHLYGQLARHGKVDWQLSDAAFNTIISLTEQYNSLVGGKWNRIMDYKPRNRTVFDAVPHTVVETPLVKERNYFLLNGNQYNTFEGEKPVQHGLGYERRAISLAKNSAVIYNYCTTEILDSVCIEVALAPNHPVNNNAIRYSIQVNDSPVYIVEYQTKGRSEEWKVNVLRNQAIHTTKHVLDKKMKDNTIRVTITALDEGVIVDQIKMQ